MKRMLLLFLTCFSCIVSAQDFKCHKESLPDMAWKETCTFTGQTIPSSYKFVRKQFQETEAQYTKPRIPKKAITYATGADNDLVKVSYLWKSKTYLLVKFDYEASSAMVQWAFKQRKHSTIFIKTVFPP